MLWMKQLSYGRKLLQGSREGLLSGLYQVQYARELLQGSREGLQGSLH